MGVTMKNLIVLLIPIIVSGCATPSYNEQLAAAHRYRDPMADERNAKRKDWVEKEYSGKELYLTSRCSAKQSESDMSDYTNYVSYSEAKIEAVTAVLNPTTNVLLANLKVSQNGKAFFFSEHLYGDTAFEKCFSKTDPLKGLSKQDKKDVLNYTYRVGMSVEALKIIKGEPTQINTTSSRHISFDQYVYNPGVIAPSYFYFSNGKLKAWQISK
jgi:hypothetical protein